MRLDKFLSEMGVGTRSGIKELARQGRITVNDQVIKAADHKLDENKDTVAVDGRSVPYAAVEYYMLNKPAGVITATEDRHTKTVLDLITTSLRKDLFPVGRLDKDTEGLLLITNDGDLAHRLLAPKKHVDKVYYAKIKGIVTKEHVEEFKKGLTLNDGTKVMPGELKILSAEPTQNSSQITLTIREGKFHQVKRMFEAVGCEVSYLKRLSMGPLSLDEDLCAGAYRPLTEEEVRVLKSAVK